MKNIIIDGVEYTPVIKKNEEIAKPIILHKSLILDFEVYPKDLGIMPWNEANKACSNLGDGWRLPTKEELNIIYENKNVGGGFANTYYWSSTEDCNFNAWYQNFYDGNQNFSYKYFAFYVRAVRTIK